jgi:hypothetical protein
MLKYKRKIEILFFHKIIRERKVVTFGWFKLEMIKHKIPCSPLCRNGIEVLNDE